MMTLWIFVATISGAFADPFVFEKMIAKKAHEKFGCYEDFKGIYQDAAEYFAECIAAPGIVTKPCIMLCFFSKLGAIDVKHKRMNLDVLENHFERLFKKGSNRPAKFVHSLEKCLHEHSPKIDWDFQKRGTCKQPENKAFVRCIKKKIHCKKRFI